MAGISAKDVKSLRDKTGAGMMDCKKALTEAEGDVEKALELLRERGLSKAGKRAGRETTEGAIAIGLSGGAAAIIELGCETDFVAKTDDYLGLATQLSELAANDAALATPEALLASQLDGETVDERVKAAVGKLGENIELKRVARLESEAGICGGYVHAGSKLGVIVSLTGGEEGLAKDIAMHVAAIDPTPIAVSRDDMPADVVAKERDFLTKQAKESGKPDNVVEKMVDGRINKFYAENCLLEQAFVKDPDKSVADVLKAAGDGVTVKGFVRLKLGEASE